MRDVAGVVNEHGNVMGLVCGLLHLEDLPADAFIAINVSPRAAVAAETRRILDQVPLDRVVMEITEHEDVDSYAALSRSLLSLRVGGMQLAVDDAGAGFSSFKHVVHLQPDMIKLDGTWIEHVDADVARRALISAVVGLFSGGTQRTALVMRASISSRPSSGRAS